MKQRTLAEKFYLMAGGVALAGVALLLSIVFAGPGLVLLTLAALLLLVGLALDLIRPAVTTLTQPPPATSAAATREK